MRIYSPPKIIRKFFDDLAWTTGNNKILLTFDDSPDPETTETILKFLNDNSVKATFFCIGSKILNYPCPAKNILREGHLIGNHSFSHRQLLTSSTKIENEIDCTQNISQKLLDYTPEYFRPPYGRFNKRLIRIAKEKKLKPVMWSLLTYDYQNDLNIVKFSVSKYLKSNSIIVFHDNEKSKKTIIDSLKFTLDEIAGRGYEIGDPAECLK